MKTKNSTTKANKVNNAKTSTLMKSMVATLLIFGASLSAQAQDNEYYNTKDEVAISIGGGTTTQIFSVFSELFSVIGEALVTGVMTGGHYVGTTTYDNEKNIPPISVEYFHHISPVVSIGAIGAFNGSFSDMYCNWQRSDGSAPVKQKVGKSSKYFITVLPAAKFDWLRKKNYGLYSKLAVGATFYSEKETQDTNGEKKNVHNETGFLFNFQASLLGVEVGSQKIRGFAEFGIGEQGLISAGLRYKF